MDDRFGHEMCGTAYDPDAVGYELQGRDAKPAAVMDADAVRAIVREEVKSAMGNGVTREDFIRLAEMIKADIKRDASRRL